MKDKLAIRTLDQDLLTLASEPGAELAVPDAALRALVRSGPVETSLRAAAILGERIRKRRPDSFEPSDQGPRWDWVSLVKGRSS